MGFALIILIFLIGLVRAEVPSLVLEFAPTVTQEIGSLPAADEFTRVDYDGDWDPENNWENLENYPRPRTVYYSVIETPTYAYLTYGFFFPRDYSSFCFWIHCHENDFEGMRVTVDKTRHRAVLLEALAHNKRAQKSDPPEIKVVIEAEGHGVYLPEERRPGKDVQIYEPSQYELRNINELWEKRHSGLFRGSFVYGGKSYPASFGGNNWNLLGFGVARPPWSWEIHNSELAKGEWFFRPGK